MLKNLSILNRMQLIPYEQFNCVLLSLMGTVFGSEQVTERIPELSPFTQIISIKQLDLSQALDQYWTFHQGIQHKKFHQNQEGITTIVTGPQNQ